MLDLNLTIELDFPSLAPFAVKPNGSKKPRGAVMPGMAFTLKGAVGESAKGAKAI